ncbi:SMP-30/gluconolactonase/LRE family protein [Amycolatopsis jejuensis]|uniref:SMP-30/gluconolactonase/LRE family protein n=1 Tax=Amycolatopsis jejuensis TaxID=330084 RepID=UPI00068D0570|nr:SMP-30/gluconolactonase/LRE family protein [Amycolatopsis jejuensis]
MLFVDSRCHLAESPRWDGGRLHWVDLEAGALWTVTDGAEPHRLDLGRATGFAELRTDGGFITAGPGGVWWIDDHGSPEWTVDLPEDWSVMRVNDGACDPAGRLLCGTTPWDAGSQPGRLHQVEPDGRVTTLLDGIGMSNGLAWNPAGDTMYHVDSLAHEITAYGYDVRTGAVGSPQHTITVDLGIPDGLTVDVEGNLWVAVWGSGRVLRYRPDGEILGHVEVPARYVTSCTFGGSQLYITTARWDLTEADLRTEPAAGGVFRCETTTTGLPLRRFAG